MPYHPGLESMDVNAKKMELQTEPAIMKALEEINPTAESSLVSICFQIDIKINCIVAGVVILHCIEKKFPEFRPKALYINTVPSPAMSVEIEFGSFRDMARGIA